MPARSRKAGARKFFLLLIVVFTVTLLFLSFWAIRRSGQKSDESLRIYNVTLSTEVYDRSRLTGIISRFPYGARQICLAFDYDGAAEESGIKVLWMIEDKLIHADSYVFSASSGSKVYGLVLEDGEPLPRGFYALRILAGTRRLSDFRFEIY
jgi:hypothetical protein